MTVCILYFLHASPPNNVKKNNTKAKIKHLTNITVAHRFMPLLYAVAGFSIFIFQIIKKNYVEFFFLTRRMDVDELAIRSFRYGQTPLSSGKTTPSFPTRTHTTDSVRSVVMR